MAFEYNVRKISTDVLALEQDILESAKMIDFYAKCLNDLEKKEGLKDVSLEARNGMFADVVKKLIEWIKKFCDQVAIWCKKIYGRSVILASKILDSNRLSRLVRKNLTSDQQKEFGSMVVHTLKDSTVETFRRATAVVNSKATGFAKRCFETETDEQVETCLYDALGSIIGAMTPMFSVTGKDDEDVTYTRENCFTRVAFCSVSHDGHDSEDEFYEDRTGFSVNRIDVFENVIELIYKAETSFCSEANVLVKSGINRLHKLQRESESSGSAPDFNILKRQLLAVAYVEKAATSACDQMAGVVYKALNDLREQLSDKFPDKNWGNEETDTEGGSVLS